MRDEAPVITATRPRSLMAVYARRLLVVDRQRRRPVAVGVDLLLALGELLLGLVERVRALRRWLIHAAAWHGGVPGT